MNAETDCQVKHKGSAVPAWRGFLDNTWRPPFSRLMRYSRCTVRYNTGVQNDCAVNALFDSAMTNSPAIWSRGVTETNCVKLRVSNPSLAVMDSSSQKSKTGMKQERSFEPFMCLDPLYRVKTAQNEESMLGWPCKADGTFIILPSITDSITECHPGVLLRWTKQRYEFSLCVNGDTQHAPQPTVCIVIRVCANVWFSQYMFYVSVFVHNHCTA